MSEITEADVLEALLPQLTEQGYTVYLHPTRLQLPPFFKDYQPDAIALRADKKLAIEIALRQTAEKNDQLPRIAKMFEGRPDKSELRVYWGSAIAPPEPLEVQTPETIKARIAEVRTLRGNGHPGPALLLGWATLEACSGDDVTRVRATAIVRQNRGDPRAGRVRHADRG